MAPSSSLAQREPYRTANAGDRAQLPAWVISLILHGALFVALAITFKVAPRGTGLESVRSVGVVLKHTTSDDTQVYYEDEGESDQFSEQATDRPNPLDDAAVAAPAAALPSADEVLGPAASALGQMPGAGDLLSGGGGSPGPLGGKARTQVFGIPADGYKFVYIFDRSGSMGGSGASALNRAKAELMASLESLGETHQFQIIFYNERPTIFNITGQRGRLVFGNHPNKAQAHKFIQGIVADGSTEHLPALLAGLNLSPDVIFFLTDADLPELTTTQLRQISDRNRRGTVINTIEFGTGPPLGENFLTRLAAQNGGQYRYVDILKR